MNKNNKIFISFIVFIICLVFFGIFINQVKNQVIASIDYQTKITRMRILNQEISEMFTRLYHLYNDEIIHTKEDEITNIIRSLENRLSKDILISKENLLDKLTSIKFLLSKKQGYIDDFRLYNANFHNAYDNLSHTYMLIMEQNLRKSTRVLIATIYNNIIALKIEEKDERALLRLESKFSNIKNATVKDFISNAKIAIESSAKLQDIASKSQALQMENYLNKLFLATKHYFTSITILATSLTILMITLLILFALLIWYLYKEQLKDKMLLTKFRKSIEESDNIVVITDDKYRITYTNDTFEKVTGYKKDEAIGKNPKILRSGIHSKNFYAGLRHTLEKGDRWSGELINRKKDGTFFYEKATITPIYNEHGKIESYIAIKLDISKNKKYQREIELKNDEMTRRYYKDQLTSLPNRNLLVEDLEKNHIGIFILLSPDNFEEIRFFYGIEATDILMVQIGKFLNKNATDMGLGKVYKVNDKNFGFWMPNFDLFENIERITAELLNRISKHGFLVKQQYIYITSTVGISYYYFTEQTDINDLLVHAEIALQHAIHNRLSYSIFDPTNKIEDYYHNNLVWTQKLIDALDNNRIVAYFQPVVDSNKKIVYYETLVRLIDSNDDVISPYFFLDIAKKAKQYIRITQNVIEQAFKKFEGTDIHFSINIDIEDISSEEIRQLLRSKLQNSKTPQNFTAEILETMSTVSYKKVNEFIKEVKGYGCKVAIDDFGSGYSNFERVVSLDVDYIKIDGSIIKNIDKDENMRKIANSIVYFSKNINKEIIAEFVSSDEIFECAKNLGIDYFQGYLFSEPKPDLMPDPTPKPDPKPTSDPKAKEEPPKTTKKTTRKPRASNTSRQKK